MISAAVCGGWAGTPYVLAMNRRRRGRRGARDGKALTTHWTPEGTKPSRVQQPATQPPGTKEAAKPLRTTGVARSSGQQRRHQREGRVGEPQRTGHLPSTGERPMVWSWEARRASTNDQLEIPQHRWHNWNADGVLWGRNLANHEHWRMHNNGIGTLYGLQKRVNNEIIQ